MNLIEFIHQSNDLSTADELTTLFLKFLKEYGMDRFNLSDLSYDTTSAKQSNFGILINYPDEWLQRYIEKGYIDIDPVCHQCVTSPRPFFWSDFRKDPRVGAGSINVLDEAKEFNVHDGVGIPLYQPMGRILGIGMTSSDQDVDIDKNMLSELHVASNQFLLAYLDMVDSERLEHPEVTLTGRETEILSWLALGKSKPVISDLLYISESTVKRHTENIFRKLQANNVPMAVFKALRMGLIRPY